MPRFNENIREGVLSALGYSRNHLFLHPLLRLVPSRSLKAKCSLSLNSCQHSHSHVRLPTFFTACLLLLCLLSTDEFVSGLDSSLPSSLIVPQFPHQASQVPSKSLTQCTWANTQLGSIQSAFQQGFQETSRTKSQELSLQRPYSSPKQVPGHTTSDQELSFYYSSLRKS